MPHSGTAESRSAARDARAGSRLRRATILIIEPDDIAQEHYRSALKPLGCSFIQVTTGHAALAVARRSIPDLVITELILPDLSGPEILSAFDADPSLCLAPIVAVSGAAAQRQLTPAVAAEFADCILKPVDAPRLRLVIQRILEQDPEKWAPGARGETPLVRP